MYALSLVCPMIFLFVKRFVGGVVLVRRVACAGCGKLDEMPPRGRYSKEKINSFGGRKEGSVYRWWGGRLYS